MKERIAISGVSGMIGSALSRSLSETGAKIIPVDRSHFYLGDFDEFYDNATYGNIYSQKEDRLIYKANFDRPFGILQSTRELPYSFFIITSTSSVDLPIQTCYSLSKKAIQDYALWFAKEYDKPVVVVKPYTITGTGDRKEHLIPTLIRSCLYGEEMPFVGEPMHDFLDVEDYVAAIQCIREHVDEFKGSVVSIGSGFSVSNNYVRLLVESVTGKRAETRTVDSLRSYDTKDWVADTFALRAMGWKPEISLRQTIERMVEHERGNSK